MKKILLIAVLFSCLTRTQAQKIIEKHIDFSAGQFLAMNLQISDSIRIITWNKAEVYIRSSIDVNDNQNNDDYKMTFEEAGTTINIAAKLDVKEVSANNGKNNCCCYRSKIYHEIYIPENAGFSVETINGNIIISGKTAEIRAHSISGFIDLSIAADSKADLTLKTISGTMYSNLELPAKSRNIRQVGGGSLTAALNGGGGQPIDLQTISGNIYFRKAG